MILNELTDEEVAWLHDLAALEPEVRAAIALVLARLVIVESEAPKALEAVAASDAGPKHKSAGT